MIYVYSKVSQRVPSSPSTVQVQMFQPENPDSLGFDVIQKQEFPSQNRRIRAEYRQLQTKLDQIVNYKKGTESPGEIRMKYDECTTEIFSLV